MYKLTNIVKIDINFDTKRVSIAKQEVAYNDDGTEFSRAPMERRAFVPGEIEVVKQYIDKDTGDEISLIDSMWTEEVIAEYQAMLAEQEQE